MAKHFDYHPPSAQANQASKKGKSTTHRASKPAKRKPVTINATLHYVRSKPDAYAISAQDGDVRRAAYNALISAHQVYEATEFHQLSSLKGGSELIAFAGEFVNLTFGSGSLAADEDEGADVADESVEEGVAA